MRRSKGRVLAMALAACIMLSHSVVAFAFETEKPDLLPGFGYSETNIEESEPETPDEKTETGLPDSEPSEPELLETQPEQPSELNIATPSDLPQPMEDKVPSEDEVRLCETLDDLIAELEKDDGGTIGFSGDGPFVFEDNVNITVTQPVTVLMPTSGLQTEEWAWVGFRGPIAFTGTQGFTVGKGSRLVLADGVSVKVQEGSVSDAPIAVSVENQGEVYTDSSVTIHADGNDAVAILFDGFCELVLRYAQVSAVGNGATAIAGKGDLIVRQAYVEAQGDDAHAICVEGAAELCLVSATGAVEANPVYSVISHYTQPPSYFIEVPIQPNKMYTARDVVYQDLAFGCLPVEFSDWAGCEFYYQALSQTDPELRPPSFYVEYTPIWDLSGLDYSVPGEYIVPATLQPHTAFPGIPIPAFTHEVTVVSPNRAALYAEISAPGRLEDTSCMAVRCRTPIADADKVLFWVWEDGWREMTTTGDAVYAEGWNPSLHPDFDFLEDDAFFQLDGMEYYSYWVVAQVIGGPMEGFSNLRQIFPGADGEGDRTGTDRYGTKPTTLPPASGTDTESFGNGGGEIQPSGSENGNEPNGSNNSASNGDNNTSGGQSGGSSIPGSGGGNTSLGWASQNGGEYTQGSEPDKDIVQSVPTDVSAIEKAEEAIQVFEPTLASVQMPKSDSNQKVTEPNATEPIATLQKSESPAAQSDRAHPTEIEAPLDLYDPEQSVPEPGFSVSTLTAFFFGAAALGVCALFYLRLRRLGR